MKLYKYQKEAIQKIDDFNGRVGLFFDMGLGKTIIALDWLVNNPKAFPAIVVCPASVKWHWEHEAWKFFKLRGLVCETRRAPNPNQFISKQNLYIINYDILPYWIDYIRNLNPQTIIIDENQYISNPKTSRTKAVKAICNKVPHVIALSGTPLLNRPIELFPTLNILKPELFNSRWSYAHKFCAAKRNHWGWDFNGSSNLKELNELLTSNGMIRKRKSEVLKDLPPKTVSVVSLPIRRPEEYERANSDFINWLHKKDPVKAQRAKRAEALVRIEYLKQLAAKLKLYYVVEWINNRLKGSDEKLILFANHRKMIEALQRRCKAKSVVLDGRTSGENRKLVVKQFQQDKNTRLFIGNTHAAGIGINLTAASTVAFTELEWQPGIHNQAAICSSFSDNATIKAKTSN